MREDHTDEFIYALRHGEALPVRADTVYAGYPGSEGEPYQLLAIRPDGKRLALAQLAGGVEDRAIASRWHRHPEQAEALARALIEDATGEHSRVCRAYSRAFVEHVINWLDWDGWTLTAGEVRQAICILRSCLYPRRARPADPPAGGPGPT